MAQSFDDAGFENVVTDKDAFQATIDDVNFAPEPSFALDIIQRLQDDIGCGTDNLWAKLPEKSDDGGGQRDSISGGGSRISNSDAGSITPTDHISAANSINDPVILAAGPLSKSSAAQDVAGGNIRLSPGGGKGFAKFQNSVPRKPTGNGSISINPDIKKVRKRILLTQGHYWGVGAPHQCPLSRSHSTLWNPSADVRNSDALS